MAMVDIPYWRVNVPEEQWPAECPEFLLNLSERVQQIVDKPDKEYHRLTWSEVKEAIGNARCLAPGFLGLPSKSITNWIASYGCHRIIGDILNTTPS